MAWIGLHFLILQIMLYVILNLAVFLFICFFSVFRCRSGLHTDIFLVLIVSITCVQTKEIKNSSSIVFQQISETHQNSSIDISSSSSSSSKPFESRSPNIAFKYHIWPTNQSINITAAITSNDSVSSQREQPQSDNLHQQQQQQRIQQFKATSTKAQRVKNFDITYSIDNNDNISLHNELAQFELPTMITSSKFHKSLKTSATVAASSEQIIARNAKHSNTLRSALRAAARQGFEAMVELYDKKEPNLISKGQRHSFCVRFQFKFLFKMASNVRRMKAKKSLYCKKINNNKNSKNAKRNQTKEKEIIVEKRLPWIRAWAMRIITIISICLCFSLFLFLRKTAAF